MFNIKPFLVFLFCVFSFSVYAESNDTEANLSSVNFSILSVVITTDNLLETKKNVVNNLNTKDIMIIDEEKNDNSQSLMNKSRFMVTYPNTVSFNSINLDMIENSVFNHKVDIETKEDKTATISFNRTAALVNGSTTLVMPGKSTAAMIIELMRSPFFEDGVTFVTFRAIV